MMEYTQYEHDDSGDMTNELHIPTLAEQNLDSWMQPWKDED
jgi:hypothetical protein